MKLAAALCCAFLNSCGGGGSSDGEHATSPAPTPTPAPASPAYENAFNFSQTRVSQAQGVELLTFYRYIQSGIPNYWVFDHHISNLHPDHDAVEIKFSSDTQSIDLNYLSNIANFPLETRERNEADEKTYYYSNTYLDRHIRIVKPDTNINYINYGMETENDYLDINHKKTERIFLYGSYTTTQDVPIQGNRNYAGHLVTTSPTLDGAGGFFSNNELMVSFANNIIEGTVATTTVSSLSPNPFIKATLRFSGRYSAANNEFSGDITSSDSSFSGVFTGRLYGPSGSEIGLIFYLRQSEAGPPRPHVIGTFIGKMR